MKVIFAGVAVLLLGVVDATASDRDALEIEGAYVLYHSNGHQRVLSFDRSGNVVLVSAFATVVGFTAGVGAWEKTGADSAKARIVDFNFDVVTGQPMGPSIVEYELTFGDLVQGKYQTVSGSNSGSQYELGQDPLAPTKDPYRTFGTTFDGKRITVK